MFCLPIKSNDANCYHTHQKNNFSSTYQSDFSLNIIYMASKDTSSTYISGIAEKQGKLDVISVH